MRARSSDDVGDHIRGALRLLQQETRVLKGAGARRSDGSDVVAGGVEIEPRAELERLAREVDPVDTEVRLQFTVDALRGGEGAQRGLDLRRRAGCRPACRPLGTPGRMPR